MKKRIPEAGIAPLFLVGLLAAGVAAQGSDPKKAPVGLPKIVVEQDVIELGEIVRGQKRETSFVVRNEGDSMLRILEAKPG